MRLLCVCLGNTCRSPMAAAVLRHLGDPGLEVRSAGTRLRQAGAPADPRAVSAAQARGYDLSGHAARALTPADFRNNDLVLTMDETNRVSAVALRPPDCDIPVQRLLDFAPELGLRDIDDPFDTGDYTGALDLIETAVSGFLARR